MDKNCSNNSCSSFIGKSSFDWKHLSLSKFAEILLENNEILNITKIGIALSGIRISSLPKSGLPEKDQDQDGKF